MLPGAAHAATGVHSGLRRFRNAPQKLPVECMHRSGVEVHGGVPEMVLECCVGFNGLDHCSSIYYLHNRKKSFSGLQNLSLIHI